MDNSVISKIQKLLARGDAERNDNEHEREIAMRQAMSMLAKHGLSMSAVENTETADPFGAPGELKVDITRAVWRQLVYGHIARLNGCKVVTAKHKGILYIIGRSTRCTVARDVAQYVNDSIHREAKRSHRAAPWQNGRSYITNFGVGAASGIGEQVNRMIRELKRGDIPDVDKSQALVVQNQYLAAVDELKSLTAKLHPRLRSTSYGGGYGNGNAQGREYGAAMNLNNNSRVGGTRQRAIGRG